MPPPGLTHESDRLGDLLGALFFVDRRLGELGLQMADHQPTRGLGESAERRHLVRLVVAAGLIQLAVDVLDRFPHELESFVAVEKLKPVIVAAVVALGSVDNVRLRFRGAGSWIERRQAVAGTKAVDEAFVAFGDHKGFSFRARDGNSTTFPPSIAALSSAPAGPTGASHGGGGQASSGDGCCSCCRTALEGAQLAAIMSSHVLI